MPLTCPLRRRVPRGRIVAGSLSSSSVAAWIAIDKPSVSNSERSPRRNSDADDQSVQSVFGLDELIGNIAAIGQGLSGKLIFRNRREMSIGAFEFGPGFAKTDGLELLSRPLRL
jgi:hypothetical protein